MIRFSEYVELVEAMVPIKTDYGSDLKNRQFDDTDDTYFIHDGNLIGVKVEKSSPGKYAAAFGQKLPGAKSNEFNNENFTMVDPVVTKNVNSLYGKVMYVVFDEARNNKAIKEITFGASVHIRNSHTNSLAKLYSFLSKNKQFLDTVERESGFVFSKEFNGQYTFKRK